jgi:hypothetical protein
MRTAAAIGGADFGPLGAPASRHFDRFAALGMAQRIRRFATLKPFAGGASWRPWLQAKGSAHYDLCDLSSSARFYIIMCRGHGAPARQWIALLLLTEPR